MTDDKAIKIDQKANYGKIKTFRGCIQFTARTDLLKRSGRCFPCLATARKLVGDLCIEIFGFLPEVGHLAARLYNTPVLHRLLEGD